MTKKTWTRLVGLAGVALVSLGVGAVAETVDAEVMPVPVVDVATYPSALPDGCPDGAAALVDPVFDNGRGEQAATLADLDVRAGDTVTLSWAGYADGCATDAGAALVNVSLAAYETPAVDFDVTVDQRLLDGWTTCGPDGGACPTGTDGRHRVSMVVPGADVACTMQLDAVLGLPLAVVGPNGSFYSEVLRHDGRPNMLIGSTALETVPCAPVPLPTTVTTAPPAVAPSEAQVTTTTAAAVLAAEVSTPPTVTVAPAALPVTGTDSTATTTLAVTLLLSGMALLGAAHRLGRAEAHR